MMIFHQKMHRGSDLETVKRGAKAVLEHLFDNHVYCDVKWCKPKQNIIANMNKNSTEVDAAGPSERIDHPPSHERSQPPAALSIIQQSSMSPANKEEEETNARPEGYYRSKEEHGKLYKQMKRIWMKLTTEDRLEECMHFFTSQKNEGMNTSVGKYARKGRTYCTTMSLTNRVMIALGTQNLGYYCFWSRVFESLNMDMSPNLKHHLMQKDNKREKKQKYEATPERKKKRARHQYDKMKTELQKQIKDNERGATYGAGTALEVATNLPVFVVEEFEQEKKLKTQKCPLVGCFGRCHTSSRSKLCFYNDCKKISQIYSKMKKYLQIKYKERYGE